MYVKKNDVRFKLNRMRRNKNNKEIIMKKKNIFKIVLSSYNLKNLIYSSRRKHKFNFHLVVYSKNPTQTYTQIYCLKCKIIVNIIRHFQYFFLPK